MVRAFSDLKVIMGGFKFRILTDSSFWLGPTFLLNNIEING